MASALVLSISLRTIFFAAFIPMEGVIPTTLRKDFSGAAYSLKYVHWILNPSLSFLLTWMRLTRRIPIFLYHHHPPSPLSRKTKMERPEKSNALLRIPVKRPQRVMSQAFLAWGVKLLRVQLHMLLCWYIPLSVRCRDSMFLIIVLYSLPSIWLMPAIGWKSTIFLTIAHYMHWLLISLRHHLIVRQNNVRMSCLNGGLRMSWSHITLI